MDIDYKQLAAAIVAENEAQRQAKQGRFNTIANIGIGLVAIILLVSGYVRFFRPDIFLGVVGNAAIQVDAGPTAGPRPVYQPAPAVFPQQQAPAQAAPVEDTQAHVEPAPQAIPTAIVYPTAEPVVEVVPRALPQLTTPTATWIPIPTPLPASITSQYQTTDEGKCVRAPRDGKIYELCQDWPYSPAEVQSVGNYLHTGLLPGTEVK